MLKLQFLNGSGKSLWLVGPTLCIGSGAQCQLRVAGRGVRDMHAELRIDGDSLLLRSAAGSCLVNKLPVDAEHRLLAGDELRIGTESWLLIDPKNELDERAALSSLRALAQAGSRVDPVVKPTSA